MNQSATIGEIAKAINAVMHEVGYVQKQAGKNLNYTYAGEAALIQALRPVMVAHGLMLLPVKADIQPLETYQTNAGGSMNLSRVASTFRLVHTSGEWIDLETPGEGSDRGDKSLNKAQTGAYKYALREAFLIETGDDPDDTASVARANAVESFRAEVRNYAESIKADAQRGETLDALIRRDVEEALAKNNLTWAQAVEQNKLPMLASEVKAILLRKDTEARNGRS